MQLCSFTGSPSLEFIPRQSAGSAKAAVPDILLLRAWKFLCQLQNLERVPKAQSYRKGWEDPRKTVPNYSQVCVRVCLQTGTHIHTLTHICNTTYSHTRIHTCLHMHTTHTHDHSHTHTYSHTHTHTNTLTHTHTHGTGRVDHCKWSLYKELEHLKISYLWRQLKGHAEGPRTNSSQILRNNCILSPIN